MKTFPRSLALFVATYGGAALAQPEPNAPAPAAAAENDWAFGEPTTSRVTPRTEGVRPPGPGGGYGRFDGDLDLGVHAGAQLFGQASSFSTSLTAHYFWMAGVYAGYTGALAPDQTDHAHVLSLGVDVRPAFLPRWSQDMQRGPGFVDLTVDSISLGLGVFWADPRDGDFGGRRGFEASLGFALPLFGSADGLWLDARGAGRWPDGGAEAEHFVVAGLAWHSVVETPLGG